MSGNNDSTNAQLSDTWDLRVNTDVGLQSLISVSEVMRGESLSIDDHILCDMSASQPQRTADESSAPFSNRRFERKVPTDVFSCIPKQTRDHHRMIARASARPGGMDVHRYWFESLVARQHESFWLHLPTGEKQTIDLLFDRGVCIFAPSLNGQLFLDATFRRDSPRLAQELILKLAQRVGKPAQRCLFSAADLGRFNSTEHRSMAQLCYRLIQRSASLHGDTTDLRCTPVDSVPVERPLVFSINELLRAHLFAVKRHHEHDLYMQIDQHAQQIWMFRRSRGLNFRDVIAGSSTDFLPLHEMMSTIDSLDAMSQQNSKVWLGLGNDNVKGVVLLKDEVIGFTTSASRLGFILYSVKPLLEGMTTTTL